jgi:predicted transcriptional regulator
MFGNTVKIKLDKDLVARLKRVADVAGYASVEEFIAHVLEREMTNFEGTDGDDDIRDKLRGLGYIS